MGKKKTAPPPKAPESAAPVEEQFDMVFHCQLAQGSPTRQVRDFTNVKQLYESIAKAFGINSSDILYCTLNTHKVDMTRLLGGQIGLDDFLFAHVKGAEKNVKVMKDGPALGLTISDNGAGYAFIKKIRENSIMHRVEDCTVGDHIAKINGQNLTGARHFEVARILKDIKLNDEFTMDLVSPEKAMSEIAPRSAQGGSGNVGAGGGKKTIRMKRDGTSSVEDVPDEKEGKMIDFVNKQMAQHILIEDEDLAREIIEYARTAKDLIEFSSVLEDKLGDFQFPDEFVLSAYEHATGK